MSFQVFGTFGESNSLSPRQFAEQFIDAWDSIPGYFRIDWPGGADGTERL
ncbi:hypothetical protein [Skermania sp. ID1734]|nr:hypothetical protein [Skermania sp. ID1734]